MPFRHDGGMDIRQLRYFMAVAGLENFSRAAQQLYIAQPALSRSMRALEEELGVRLFERHLRGATLTPEGRALMDRAKALLRNFDQIKSDIQDKQVTAAGPVAIGMTPNFAMVAGVAITRRVLQQFPAAQLQIVEAYSPALRDMLRDGAIDIALLSGSSSRPSPTLAVEPLFEERLCLVGRAADPVMKASEISIARLAGLPLILSGTAVAGIRNELESQARRQRVPLHVVVEVGSFELASRMVLDGMGYTVYSASGIAGVYDADRLAAVPIAKLWLQRSVAWPLNRPLLRLAGEVLAVARETLTQLVRRGDWPLTRSLQKPRGRKPRAPTPV